MFLTKQKAVKMDKSEIKSEVDKVGRNIQTQLESHFKQWQAGLPFRVVMSPYSARAKNLGFGGASEFSLELQELGYIKLFSSPAGRRFIFSGKCTLTDEEIVEWLQDQEMIRDAEKEHKKLHKSI